MDTALHPPLRIHAGASTSISSKSAIAQLDSFLDDFQARSTTSKGGDASLTVQLQKLRAALREERDRRKKSSS